MSRQRLIQKNRAGDRVSASTLNEFRREMQRNRVVHSPSSVQTLQTPAGLLVNQPRKNGIIWAKAPGGGIAAGSSGTVTIYANVRSRTLSSTTFTAYNDTPDAIPSGGKLLAIVGDSITSWSCNNMP